MVIDNFSTFSLIVEPITLYKLNQNHKNTAAERKSEQKFFHFSPSDPPENSLMHSLASSTSRVVLKVPTPSMLGGGRSNKVSQKKRKKKNRRFYFRSVPFPSR